MILASALGHEEQVRTLLEKSMIQWDRRQINAWMDWQFDPEHMYLMIKDGMPVSCLQLRTEILQLQEHQIQVCMPTLFCTHPDYRLTKCFGKLLDAAISTSASNELLMLAITDQAKVLEKRSFQTVARTREFWARSADIPPMHDGTVYPWRSGEDLYPIYCRFVDNFGIAIKLDERSFKDQIGYASASNKRIWIAYGPHFRAEGFAVTTQNKDQIRIHTIVYENSRALLNLLAKATSHAKDIAIETGPSEALGRIVDNMQRRPKYSIMVRLSNYKVVSRWLNEDIRSAQELFAHLEAPIWMGLIQS